MAKGNIIDYGCGSGLYSARFQNHRKVVQADIIDRRAREAKHLPFFKLDINKDTLVEGEFGNVIAFDVIEHLDDDLSFLNNLKAKMTKGSRIFISVPADDNSILEKVYLAPIHYTDKTHRREYSLEKLKNLARKAKLKVVFSSPQYNESIVQVA